ncbi:MAG: thioredoxin family protein [Verrucomicrobiota bacterium JB022]|nr:thioredoxin family protein [Verrucomicrobiota bacterium JB022]
MKRLLLWSCLCLATALHAGLEDLQVGDAAAKVERELGAPTGKMGRAGKMEIWQYPGATIKLVAGKIASIERRGSNAAGNPAAPFNTVRAVVPKVKEIRDNGKAFALETVTVKGQVTVVDFFADWCGPCKKISPVLEDMAQHHEGVVLRKVDIVTWDRPVVKQFDIRAIPFILVFDRNGQIVGEPTSDPRVVYTQVRAALAQQ